MPNRSRTPQDQQAPGMLLLGRREYVTFPEWGLDRVRAKIDTGAYSSVLDVQEYELRGGAQAGWTACLRIVPNRKKPSSLCTVTVPVVKRVRVRSSCGADEYRPLVEVPIRLGSVVQTIRLTVTNRARMRLPMLLGRQALAGRFLVDVQRKYVLTG